MTHEVPAQDDVDTALSAALGFDTTSVRLEKVESGFSGAQKCIVFDTVSHQPTGFAKFIHVSNPQEDHQVIDAEIKNYALLSRLSLTGTILPTVQTVIDTPEYRGLVIDYYDGATWGGPWNRQTMLAVEAVLATLHGTQLSDEIKAELRATQDSLDNQIPIRTQYHQGKLAFHTSTIITNSRDETVCQTPDDALFRQLFIGDRGTLIKNALIFQDANLHNFCITLDQSAHLVDPVYLRVGDPYQDKINIARDILMSADLSDEDRNYLMTHFFPQDATNQQLLDSIAYGLYASQLPYDESNASWMDYQQKGLTTLIDVWYSLRSRNL